MIKTPVIFFIFKRVETTEKVFEAIREVKPSKLFVIADGARINRPGELELCKRTRKIIDRVDWECEVIKNYSDVNLGCKNRISSGLDWVFQHVEEAIILEDDCLPHPSFFTFCEELLEKYKTDNRIVSIGGNNFQNGYVRNQDSYYFSRYFHCWGWATWKRSWQHYDGQMKLWNKFNCEKWLYDILLDKKAVKYWAKIFQSTFEGKINSWAYCFIFNCWTQSGLNIIPNVNLVSNIGYGTGATHTSNENSKFNNIPRLKMSFPLKHPDLIIRNNITDNFTQKTHFSRISLIERCLYKLKKIQNSYCSK